MDQPVPESLQADLGVIMEAFPESIYDLHDLTESPVKRPIQDLGWSKEQAASIRYHLAAFREDWEAPGMEIYDDL